MAQSGTKQTYNVLLLGKTGHGKTLTAASLFGVDIFDKRNLKSSRTSIKSSPSDDFISCMDVPTTETMDAGSFTLRDASVNVIDSPGLFDASTVDEVTAAFNTIENMNKAFDIVEKKTEGGIHAFVIVFKFGVRYTKEEQKVIQNILMLFRRETHVKVDTMGKCDKDRTNEGKSLLSEQVIIIFTNGDDYRLQHKNTDFEEWLFDQSGEMKKLIEICNDRIVLFENLRYTEESRKVQRGKFMKLLETMNKQIGSEKMTEYGKNKVIKQAEIDYRKSTFRKNLYDLQNQALAAHNEKHGEEKKQALRQIGEKTMKLIAEAHPEDREQCEREIGEIQKVIDSIEKSKKKYSDSGSFDPTHYP